MIPVTWHDFETMQFEIERLTNALRIYADRDHWHPRYASFYIGPRYNAPWEVAERALEAHLAMLEQQVPHDVVYPEDSTPGRILKENG